MASAFVLAPRENYRSCQSAASNGCARAALQPLRASIGPMLQGEWAQVAHPPHALTECCACRAAEFTRAPGPLGRFVWAVERRVTHLHSPRHTTQFAWATRRWRRPPQPSGSEETGKLERIVHLMPRGICFEIEHAQLGVFTAAGFGSHIYHFCDIF